MPRLSQLTTALGSRSQGGPGDGRRSEGGGGSEKESPKAKLAPAPLGEGPPLSSNGRSAITKRLKNPRLASPDNLATKGEYHSGIPKDSKHNAAWGTC